MIRRVAFLDYSPVFAGAERVLYNVIAHIGNYSGHPIGRLSHQRPIKIGRECLA